jgi:hypothetical protein
MIAEHQIRQQLAKYLHGEVSLDLFEDWLVQRSWNMHRDSDEAAQKLASAIELRLAEHSSGHLDDEQLREELRPFVTTYTAVVSFGQPSAAVPSNDAHYSSPTPRTFVVHQAEVFQPLFDTQLAAGPA